MEGLIPMVYQAIKRNRVRREYRCLSSGDAQSYNIADFYINDQSHVYTLPSTQKIGAGLHIERNGHRRHRSVGDYGVGFTPPEDLKSDRLCRQCSKCDTSKCPASEAFPHMTAFDDTLIAGALQSDFVDLNDRGVYSVPDIKGGESTTYNAYFGWKSTSGSASGFHRFSNYMDKCSGGEMYLSVDKHGKVSLRSLNSLESLAEADWKSINPPKKLSHREFRFWVSSSTRKCLTVFEGKTRKRTVGVAECKMDGSNPFQLFAFRFHYHKAFCCCGVQNQ